MMKKLRSVLSFSEYLTVLLEIMDRYTIVVCACDAICNTQTGDEKYRSSVRECAKLFCRLGFRIDIAQQSRKAFVGVVDDGKPVFERLSDVEIRFDDRIGDTEVEVISQTFAHGQSACIKLDGKNHACGYLGLNFVVFDKYTQTMADAVCFNTFEMKSAFRDITEVLKSKLALLYSHGYDIVHYLLDNRIYAPVFYMREQDAEVFVPVLNSLVVHDGPIKAQFVSDSDYTQSLRPLKIFRNVVFKKAGTVSVSPSSILILLSPVFVSPQLVSSIQPDRNAVLYINKVLDKALHYAGFVRPLVEFARRHPKNPLIVFDMPRMLPGGRSKTEKALAAGRYFSGKTVSELAAGSFPFDTFRDSTIKTHAEILKHRTMFFRQHLDEFGVIRRPDVESEYFNVKNGERRVARQPKNPKRHIYVGFDCNISGIFGADERTVALHLQDAVNEAFPEDAVCVHGSATVHLHLYKWLYNTLYALPLSDGDIVVFSTSETPVAGSYNLDCMEFLDLKKLFWKEHDYGEVFLDCGVVPHLTEGGYKGVAVALFDFLRSRDFFRNYDSRAKLRRLDTTPVEILGIPKNDRQRRDGEQSQSESDAALREYKASLDAHRLKIGAAVMNCNPFTRGHRCLVEYAAAQVAWLYVFVVEEDKSVFPFDDRLALVREGTNDLRNVTVLPSGKFIISSLTFTDYFNKSELQDRTVDPTRDVELFGRHIAPALGITVRFAGEEPLDNVTRQYNEAMRGILPRYGVEFVEIPRREEAGEPISASRVRKLLEAKDFDGIKRLVPDTTFEYLMKFAGGGC